MKSQSVFGALKLSTFLTSYFILASAFAGGSHTGGGDPLEQAFKEVTTNIVQWIKSGNASDLKLPEGISYSQYVTEMQKVTSSFSVSFSSTTRIQGVDKVCINTRNAKRVLIVCNRTLFSELVREDRQELYRLIHHEFAGAARLEKNEGANSDYRISDQVSANLRWEKVLRLPIERVKEKAKKYDTQFSCIRAEGSFADDIEFQFRFNSGGTFLEMKASYAGQLRFGEEWVPAHFNKSDLEGLTIVIADGSRSISFAQRLSSPEEAANELDGGGLINYNASHAEEDYLTLSKDLKSDEMILMTRSDYDPEVYRHIYPIPLIVKCRQDK